MSANQHFASTFSMQIFNSRDVVASSPSFSRPSPPSPGRPWELARRLFLGPRPYPVPRFWRIPLPGEWRSNPISRQEIFRFSEYPTLRRSNRGSREYPFRPWANLHLKEYLSISWKKLSVYFKLINTKSHFKRYFFKLVLMYVLA